MSTQISLPDDDGLRRFSIISPLLHPSEDGVTQRARLEELAKRVYHTAEGHQRRYHADTLRDWLDNYRKCGLDGLRSKPRKDRGATSVPVELQEALIELRKQQPAWTVKRLLRTLRLEETWNGYTPSRSALYRFAKTHDLGRNICPCAQPVHTFEFPYFGDLWCGDFLHGPLVCRGVYADKTYLHAIIDDATRYVVVARFHLSEDVRSLLDDLMLAIRRFGIPKRLYTDNGAAFRSNHLRLVAAKLSVALPHTPPYTPRGRGKVERFFRTVREGFLNGRGKTSLDKLNADFAKWIDEYHHTRHSSLNMSPLERKLTDTGPQLKAIPTTQNINDIFRMECCKRVGSDGCVRMFKKRFEIPNAIPGETVIIYYLPWEQGYILAGPDKIFVKPLDAVKNALRFDKPRRGRPTDTTTGEKS
jgi:putative transposase